MRICNVCRDEKDWSEFYTDRRSPSGYASICKVCRRIKRRENWANNHLGQRDRELARYALRNDEFRHNQFVQRLKRVYNITEAQYLDLVEAQNGICALCELPETKIHHLSVDDGPMRLTIDHDHACCPSNKMTCGRCIRGLLCYECNLLIGKVEAKPLLRLRFKDYLDLRPFV